MIGAIIGDIIGSQYEARGASGISSNEKLQYNFKHCRATDDSILTIALADSILNNIDYARNLKEYYNRYPEKGYGPSFAMWAQGEHFTPYLSTGNGSIMRTSSVGWAFDSLEEIYKNAKGYCSATHNSESAIKAAKCISSMIYILRTTKSKELAMNHAILVFRYDVADIEKCIKNPRFSATAHEIMPQVLASFAHGESYTECIKLAVLSDNDTDTCACIVGALAETIYDIPQELVDGLPKFLDVNLLNIIVKFHDKYINKYNISSLKELIPGTENVHNKYDSYINNAIDKKEYLVVSRNENSKKFINPVRHTYIHKTCGTETAMHISVAEQFAMNPTFYLKTYCISCKDRFPLSEFVWEDNTPVGL